MKSERRQQRGPAGLADALGVAFAQRNADADGGGLAEAERDHEGDGGQLQRHGVGGDFGGAEPALKQRGAGEEAHFGEQHEADGAADAPDLEKARPVGFEEAGEDVVAAVAAVGDDVAQHHGQHGEVDQRGGDAGTGELEARKAPVAEDQRVVGEEVEHRAEHRDDEDDAGGAEGGEERAGDDQHEGRHEQPDGVVDEDLGQRRRARGPGRWRCRSARCSRRWERAGRPARWRPRSPGGRCGGPGGGHRRRWPGRPWGRRRW